MVDGIALMLSVVANVGTKLINVGEVVSSLMGNLIGHTIVLTVVLNVDLCWVRALLKIQNICCNGPVSIVLKLANGV